MAVVAPTPAAVAWQRQQQRVMERMRGWEENSARERGVWQWWWLCCGSRRNKEDIERDDRSLISQKNEFGCFGSSKSCFVVWIRVHLPSLTDFIREAERNSDERDFGGSSVVMGLCLEL